MKNCDVETMFETVEKTDEQRKHLRQIQIQNAMCVDQE